MAIITDSSWATTFFYEQDLKSAYMNGALNAGFRPGIYNGGISLYTKSYSENADSGVFLHIKKGTTFIFSNSYSSTTPYKRDVSSIGSYLIKSVALEDINLCLVTVTAGSDHTQARDYILGRSATSTVAAKNPAKQFYISAIMAYHADKSGGYDVPKFVCAIDNPDYSEGTEGAEKYNYFFKTLNNEGSTDVAYPIPEGGKTSSANTSIVSYLMVGTVIDKTPKDDLGPTTYELWNTLLANNWLNNHTLISRCFEDYRQNISSTNKTLEANAVVGSDLNSIYLDTSSLVVKDSIYKKEAPWQRVYLLPSYQALPEGTGITLDTVDLSSYISTTDRAMIVTDFIYAPLKNHKSSITKYDLINMFKNGSTSEEKLTLKDYRFVSDYDLSTSLAVLTDTIKLNTTVLPADIHTVTLARIRSLVENRSVLPLLVDVMRRDSVNGVTPDTCDSILPIAMVFRGFTVKTTGDVVASDTISSTSTFNPANVLSLLELNHTSAKIDTVPVMVNDAYAVLPIIE